MMETDIFLDEQNKEARRKLLTDIEVRQLQTDLSEVFGTPAGRRVYAWLLQECKVFESTMTANSWTYFNEGKRAVGLLLMRMLDQKRIEALESMEINQMELFLQQKRNEAKADE